ncbi:TniA putative transposase [Azospirillum argentinense]|uniref:Mu transposase C-terminal domain-containing protein n=1 Tax=Azospirillum argentinense TaxID=2970906 RepID=UPI0032DEBF2F
MAPRNIPDIQAIPLEIWEATRTVEQVVRPLADLVRPPRSVMEEAAATLGVSRATIYRMVARYRADPRTSSLIVSRGGRPAGLRLIPSEVESIIDHRINTSYLTKQKPRLAALHKEIQAACHEKRLPAPSYNTVASRVRELNARQVLAKREGGKVARNKFGLVTTAFVAEGPNSVWQIDHTLVDLIVLDEYFREPVGRPWVTFIIDVATRMVAGFYLTLDPPSTTSVALALTHAVLPKDEWLRNRSIDGAWPICGLPQALHMDNAKEFHSKDIKRGCEEYGIATQYRPVRTPHFGGHIERLIGTMMGAVHLLPGTTHSNSQERGEYRSAEHSAMTMRELEAYLAREIVGTYHNTVHSSLSMPPNKKWRDTVASMPGQAPRQPKDHRQFVLDFLPSKPRRVLRDGIHLFNIVYFDRVLATWLTSDNRDVEVKYDPRNISRVYIRDDEGRYFDIPYRNTSYPPITLAEHRRAVRRLRDEGRRAIDEDLLFQTIAQQRRLIADAVTKTKARREELGKAPANAGKATKAARRSIEHTVTSIAGTRAPARGKEPVTPPTQCLSAPEPPGCRGDVGGTRKAPSPSLPEPTAPVQATDDHFDIEVWP